MTSLHTFTRLELNPAEAKYIKVKGNENVESQRKFSSI